MASRSSSSPAAALSDRGTVAVDFHIVYRVTTGKAASTEELYVHRPFEAADTTTDGSGSTISSLIVRLGRQRIQASGGNPIVLETPAAAASVAVRIDTVAADAAKAHALVPAGTATVAGRHCNLVRTAEPLESATLDRPPTNADHTDTCVEGGGLVLREEVVSHGKLIRQKVATVADFTAAPGTTFATPGPHLIRSQGGGFAVAVTNDSRPPGIPFWQLPATPAGFSHLARFAVALPTPSAPPGGSQNKSPVITAIDDVYLRGPNVIVIEQAETLGGESIPTSKGTDVDLGPLGFGQLELSAVASSVTAQPQNKSSYVRVTGTVTPAELVRIARSLDKLPPGTLVTVPGGVTDGS